MKQIEVVAAIIRKGDLIFATQRGYGEWQGWWEFPGGKMEAGETREEALQREIREELSAEISVDDFLCTVEHNYPKFRIRMHCFLCSLRSDRLSLNEHEAARWLGRDEMDSVKWLPADLKVLDELRKRHQSVSPDLQQYIEENILPRYDAFDKAHRQAHARMVIRQSMDLAEHLEVNIDMVYAIAAYHDTGLCEGREHHHEASARIIRADQHLHRWFSGEQIQVMADAVEDHRASAGHEPRTIYGRIVAEADRHIDPQDIIERTVQFGLDHYPELSREEHFERMKQHLHEKYGRNGYLKLWFAESDNARQLEKLQGMMDDEGLLHELFERFYYTDNN